MKKNEVKVGNVYVAKVSDRLTEVRIDSTNTHGGWNATNVATGKRIHVKSAQRLRGPAGKKRGKREDVAAPAVDATEVTGTNAEPQAEGENTQQTAEATAGETTTETAKPGKKRQGRAKKSDGEKKAKRVSALDAAAQVLQQAGKAMNSQEMIVAMAEQGLWDSPNGKTPHATLYAAIIREIATKGDTARFRKTERGQFVSAGTGA